MNTATNASSLRPVLRSLGDLLVSEGHVVRRVPPRPVLPFHGCIVVRCGTVIPFKAPVRLAKADAPKAEPSAPSIAKLDCNTFQATHGGVWHEFDGLDRMIPVAKCGRRGTYSTKIRKGQTSCRDCSAKGTK